MRLAGAWHQTALPRSRRIGSMPQPSLPSAPADMSFSIPQKLHGRAFYESIGSPKMVIAPMVDRSEFAWRMLTRSYIDEESKKSLLAYTPMMHARLFQSAPRFRDTYFQPTRSSLTTKEKSTAPAYLDGNPAIDRPLFVQFCANKPDELLDAARYVAPYCDAVDLNLGCPQGIAKAGHYGAFLQEDWDTIRELISKLREELAVPVTAKIRILETKEKTLEYAKMVLAAGASIITVHGRRREQKGHNMGVADWSVIRYLRNNLAPDTVIFANGNIMNRDDILPCLEATGADAVMSAEGNLSDPTIFAKPPRPGEEDREYWRGSNGQEGYRIDGVVRRYLNIIYQYVLDSAAPVRQPLFLPIDPPSPPARLNTNSSNEDESERPKKRHKADGNAKKSSPNLRPLQGHLFQLFRPFIATHTEIRDALAKSRLGDMDAFENVLRLLEEAVKKSLQEEALHPDGEDLQNDEETETTDDGEVSSKETVAKYRRPWWICQPYIRPLPEEAMKNGALKVSKKEKERAQAGIEERAEEGNKTSQPIGQMEKASEPAAESTKSSSRVPNALVCG